MFFALSKLLDLAVDPFWWSAVPLAAGVFLLVRGSQRRRLALVLVALGLSTLLLGCLPSVSNRLWASLESGVAPTMSPGVTYDAVVLLGGVVSPQGSLRDDPAWNDNIERLLEVRQVLISGRAKVAIVSGGKLGGDLLTEADYLARGLERLGVPKEQVLIEAKANNTRENATESKRLLEQLGARRVLLVTSAFHMPRALGCFRAVGLEVDTLPVDYRMRDVASDPHLLPRAEYLGQSSRALREWLGRLVYRVLGYTK
jgi:uncharacterized SAM-binding protein YcdF (DUF218 family)